MSGNKVTKAMKEWASELFHSAEWRDSAKARMVKGKAPHLESHVLQVLMPKTEKHEHSGSVQVVASDSDARL